MKVFFKRTALPILAGLGTLLLVSCADPYYSSGVGSTTVYTGGYGDGYGYGSSAFTTSFFISTGNPTWGYDPYCHSYYNYQRQCYYDPYLHGYYPRGYRPVRVIGAPHPHGWRPGRNSIAPPTRITNVTINNYNNRGELYRERVDQPWARNVRVDRTPVAADPIARRAREQETQRVRSQNPARGADDSRGRAPRSNNPIGGGSSAIPNRGSRSQPASPSSSQTPVVVDRRAARDTRATLPRQVQPPQRVERPSAPQRPSPAPSRPTRTEGAGPSPGLSGGGARAERSAPVPSRGAPTQGRRSR